MAYANIHVVMGNCKNKCNHRNNHRHVFKRKYHPEKYWKHANTQESVLIQGSRIVNLEKLQEYINSLTMHAAQCGSDILLAGEKQSGLASIISTRCSKCSYTITLETSHKVKGPRGYHLWECNLAAVLGQMSTGGVTLNTVRQWVYLVFLSCQQDISLALNGTLGSGGEVSSKKR